MNLLFQQYVHSVADYIDCEYDNRLDNFVMSDKHRWAIKNILTSHYSEGDSINNAANSIIRYLKKHKQWQQEDIHE